MAIQLHQILSNAAAGSIFTAQPPFSIHVSQAQIRSVINPLLVQTELNQAEGTPLELRIQNVSNASHIASRMNAQYHQGKLKDMPTGENIIPWQGATNIAFVQGSTLILRWRKGQAFIVVLGWSLVIVAAAIATFLLIRHLMQSPWSLSRGIVPGSSGGSTSGGGPFGLPWWEVIIGGAAIGIGGPFVLNEVARWYRADRNLRQAEHGGGSHG